MATRLANEFTDFLQAGEYPRSVVKHDSDSFETVYIPVDLETEYIQEEIQAII